MRNSLSGMKQKLLIPLFVLLLAGLSGFAQRGGRGGGRAFTGSVRGGGGFSGSHGYVGGVSHGYGGAAYGGRGNVGGYGHGFSGYCYRGGYYGHGRFGGY